MLCICSSIHATWQEAYKQGALQDAKFRKKDERKLEKLQECSASAQLPIDAPAAYSQATSLQKHKTEGGDSAAGNFCKSTVSASFSIVKAREYAHSGGSGSLLQTGPVSASFHLASWQKVRLYMMFLSAVESTPVKINALSSVRCSWKQLLI